MLKSARVAAPRRFGLPADRNSPGSRQRSLPDRLPAAAHGSRVDRLSVVVIEHVSISHHKPGQALRHLPSRDVAHTRSRPHNLRAFAPAGVAAPWASALAKRQTPDGFVARAAKFGGAFFLEAAAARFWTSRRQTSPSWISACGADWLSWRLRGVVPKPFARGPCSSAVQLRARTPTTNRKRCLVTIQEPMFGKEHCSQSIAGSWRPSL